MKKEETISTTVEKVVEEVKTVQAVQVEKVTQLLVEQTDRNVRFKATQTYDAYIGGVLYVFKKDVTVVIPQSVAVMQSNNNYGFIY